jgi:predicted homoserine dehydrogenase-like protein
VIIIDDALKRIASAGRPIRVALIGAGFMGRGIALQIITAATGIHLAVIVARNLGSARRACVEADTQWREVDTPSGLQAAIEEGVTAITQDWRLACENETIDAIIEVTGSLDYAAAVVCAAIEKAVELLPTKDFMHTAGIIDYVVVASPAPGVFVLGVMEHPAQRHYLALYKLGEGPLYCFYTPYHLCHFEVPNSVARAVLFHDAAIAPAGPPCVEVVTTAKRDLRRGEIIDDMSWYMTYGQAENADVTHRDRLLPMGLAAGCRLVNDVARDRVLTYDDVELPGNRLIDRLRAEQEECFFGVSWNTMRRTAAALSMFEYDRR